MPTQLPPLVTPTTFTPAERQAQCALRARYRQHRDLLRETELTHLRILRWLYQTPAWSHRQALSPGRTQQTGGPMR
jgi:hypothetical protein